MFPKLFEIPLWPAVKTSWPVFAVLVVVLMVAVSWAAKVGEKSKVKGQLLSILPTVAFVTAFVTFLETPFGKMPINSYGFCIMVGFLLASWIAVKRGKELGIPSDFILDVGIIAMIFGIVGAKINYILQYSKDLDEIGKVALWGDSGLHPLGALLLGPIPFAFWFYRMKQSGQKVRLYSWQTGVLLVLTLILAFVGTRALHLYQHRDEYSWKVFRNWQSGFVLYGGLIAGVAAGVLYTKMRAMSVAVIADLSAAPMMLALAFGRLGCFMNGCCHGQKGEAFTCISFPAGSPAAEEFPGGPGGRSMRVHPTQLYETIAAVGMFFLLSWIYRRKRKAQGEVFLIMAMLYGGWRFLIEFARGDKRPDWGGLSYSQWVSLAAFVVSGVWLFLLRARARSTADPIPPAAPAPPAGPPAPTAP
jgi:phosphatidylglycerol---prolipoprotein diacylglyceryl transferase